MELNKLKLNRDSQKLAALIFVVFFTLIPFLINHIFLIDFYISGSFEEYKRWFPFLYYLVFAFSKLYFPFLFAFWVYIEYLIIARKRNLFMLFLAFQSFVLLIIIFCYAKWCFTFLYYYFAILLFVTIVTYYCYFFYFYFNFYFNLYGKNLNYFIYFSYILLSAFLSEFHPFSRYPMYSTLADNAYVFYLKNVKGEIVPFDKFFRISGTEISHLYYSLYSVHHYSFTDSDTSATTIRPIGNEMFHYILSTQYKTPTVDTLNLYRSCIHLKKGKIIRDEILLYKGKVR